MTQSPLQKFFTRIAMVWATASVLAGVLLILVLMACFVFIGLHVVNGSR